MCTAEVNCSVNYDIVLKNGLVIDPKNKRNEILDVAIQNGKIAAIGNGITGNATKVVDASGCFVSPGFIDMHCHIYPKIATHPDVLPNVNPDAHMLASGVTTAVDAGTCGWRDFLQFKQDIIDRSRVQILSFINIACNGMVNLSSEQNPDDFHYKVAAAIAQTFPNLIVGVKAAHYWGDKPFDAKHPAWASVDRGLEAAELCGKPLMVDFKPNLPECSYQALILDKLRKGDIHTHLYAQQFPVVDSSGKVYDYMHKARERGVHFDLGHGAGSFWFRSAVPSYRDGFGPDTLSTDLYLANVNGPVVNLLNIMSKYMAIGMDLYTLIDKVTYRAAKAIGHEELGSLDIGSCADVAIIRKLEGRYGFTDCGNAKLEASAKLDCVATIREGRMAYDPYGFAMPNWQEAPQAYWTGTGVL